MYSEGYFSQRISEDGWQDAINNPLNFEELPVLKVLDENGQPFDGERWTSPDRR